MANRGRRLFDGVSATSYKLFQDGGQSACRLQAVVKSVYQVRMRGLRFHGA